MTSRPHSPGGSKGSDGESVLRGIKAFIRQRCTEASVVLVPPMDTSNEQASSRVRKTNQWREGGRVKHAPPPQMGTSTTGRLQARAISPPPPPTPSRGRPGLSLWGVQGRTNRARAPGRSLYSPGVSASGHVQLRRSTALREGPRALSRPRPTTEANSRRTDGPLCGLQLK